ncbi:MAG: glycosyltransferase [Sphingobacteriaceae bacterium]
MIKTKNILIISAADPYRSAGIVALDLLNGLSTFEGNQVKLISKFCKPQNQNVISFLKPIEHNFERIINKFKKLLINLKLKENKIKYTNPDYHVLDFDQTKTFYKTEQILKKIAFQPTHIVILFTQNFISFKNIYELNKTTGASIYLYPMDMAHLTGACHYAWDCVGYKNTCSTCPAIVVQSNRMQPELNQSFKEQFINKTDITIFACNEQIKKQIEGSAIFKNKKVIGEIYPIPDRTIFYPEDKLNCKKHLGIEMNQVVLFFGSVSFKDRRKGMAILQAALFKLENELRKINFDLKKITFLTAGSKCEIQEWPTSHFNFIELGYVNDYKMLAKAYNASDFFISPSIEETGPTMVLQSILCETPAITFDLGYSNELYTSKLRQLISNEKNASSLMNVILNSLKMHENLKDELTKINSKLNFNTIINKINNSMV